MVFVHQVLSHQWFLDHLRWNFPLASVLASANWKIPGHFSGYFTGYRTTNKAMFYTIKQVALGNESRLTFLWCSHKCKRQLENIYSWAPSITYDRTMVQRVCDSTKVIEWLHGRADSRTQNF